MPDFDPRATERAFRMLETARTKAYERKLGVALRQKDWKKTITNLVVAAGTEKAGFFIATAIATAAGASTAALTFGIAPAVGIVVGLAAAKAKAEIMYHLDSEKLKQGIHDDGGEEVFINDPSLLVPCILKILRKLSRVQRRVDQINGKGTTFLRHAVTAVRASLNRDQHLANPMVTGAYADPELNSYCQKLRFYSQLLWNYLQKIIDDVIVRQRNEVAAFASRAIAHTIRLAHFTSDHNHCQTPDCCGPSDQEYNSTILPQIALWVQSLPLNMGQGLNLRRGYRDNIVRQGAPLNDQMEQWRQRGAAQGGQDFDPFAAGRALAANDEAYVNFRADRDEEELGEQVKDFLQDRAVDYTVGTFSSISYTAMTTIQDLSKEGFEEAAKGLSDTNTITSGLSGSAYAAGVDVLVDEFFTARHNYRTRAAVLNHSGMAKQLWQSQGQDARDAALRDLFGIIKEEKDLLSRAPRVAAKCASYVGKIQRLFDVQNEMLRTVARNQPLNQRLHQDLQATAFASCDEAYQVNRGFFYLFHNYEKMLTFMTYLEAILLYVEGQVVSMGIGVDKGQIIDLRPNAQVIRPTQEVKSLSTRAKDSVAETTTRAKNRAASLINSLRNP